MRSFNVNFVADSVDLERQGYEDRLIWDFQVEDRHFMVAFVEESLTVALQ